MREVIKTAKTVEEATELALAELGVSADEAMIEVLDLPQRRLFRSIPAKVRVYIEEEPAAPAAPAAEKPMEKPAPKAPRAERGAPRAAKGAEKAAPKAEKSAAKAERSTARQILEEQPPVPVPAEEAKAPRAEAGAEEPIDISVDEKARTAVQYLRAVCGKMGAEKIDVCPVRAGEAMVLRIEGEGAGMLIGHRGEVMEALSYLVSLVANRVDGEYTKISLDINHYRSKREANLTALARRIGAKVARTGRGHTLEPMNPYERRIIHSAISEMEGVKSESIGEGANRRVVISCTNPNLRPPRGGSGRSGSTGRSGGSGRSGRGPRRDGDRGPRVSTPQREFADKPRDPNAKPTVPVRTETINDGADLPLYGKIELF